MRFSEQLTEIDRLSKLIAERGDFPPDVLKKINYKFRLDWNYYSNSMEGNTLTKEETRGVMMGNLNVENKPLKDVLEMNGHNKVVEEVLLMGKGEKRLSEARIKQIHTGIMYEDDPKMKNLIGVWKTIPNHVINYKNEKFDFASPSEVPDKIHQLLNELNAGIDAIERSDKKAPHPVVLALNFHLEYLNIHPFYDGNGRTARILTNLILISQGLPPLIIKETDKEAYYRYLADIQCYGGNSDLLFSFMAKLLTRSLETILKALNGESIEDPDDLDKEIKLRSKKLSIPDKIRRSPRLTYKVCQLINTELAEKVEQTLYKFEAFFDEIRRYHLVDGFEEQYKKRQRGFGSIVTLLEVSDAPKELKVFGYDVYKNKIDRVDWRWELWGLKGSMVDKYRVDVTVHFSFENYTITVSMDREEISSFSNDYVEIELPFDSAEKQVDIVKRAVWEKIKRDTEEEI